MKTYTVSYRKIGAWRWQVLERVKGDGYVQDSARLQRFFILEDETRVEIPVPGVEFEFCRGRYESILATAEAQAAQKLALKPEVAT